MSINFKEQFGINAGYVEALFEQWKASPTVVDPQWAAYFHDQIFGEDASATPAEEKTSVAGSAPTKETGSDPAKEVPTDRDRAPLRGIPARIAENMNASLSVPTATTVRTLPVKALVENRAIINAHMRDRALGKASFTHLVAFAMIQAVKEIPNLQAYYEEEGGKGFKVTPHHVNIGLAIDIGEGEKRSLVVPNIKKAETMNFSEFYAAYQDLVGRGRKGKLTSADFADTTFTLTNPGGFGTEMSVPRLMQGQGLILAAGSIGLPVHARQMNPEMLAEVALGPVMTLTSTYDHRTIQGAESGLLLKRIEELLEGEADFWDSIFSNLRLPWRPAIASPDQHVHNDEHIAEEQAKVWQLISAYRSRGCQLADLDPLEYKPDFLPSLDPAWYGFTIWDLDREFLTDGLCGKPRMTLREILEVLRETYCRRWTTESMHIVDRIRKHWVRKRIEDRRNEDVFTPEHRGHILERLIRAENFERFLHTRYPGNKRFSLEGADTLIPAIAEILDRVAEDGVQRIVIGMSHRGRLNVLANILNKSTEKIFREFEGVLLPGEAEGSGDVKYHLGQQGTYVTSSGKKLEVHLTANPSHLESVNPVVCGQVRAWQDKEQDAERKKTLGILIHGDAAFTGQGVVAETLQMSGLPGYETGGTIHLVVNNQIGFTAGPKDLHTSYYCTDLAKMIEAPIMHANGDYPESMMRACHVATDYQREYGADVVVDMVCYRRRGHNEGDEPMYTQPLIYKKISEHPTVRENYTSLLERRGQMTRKECDAVGEKVDAKLREALAKSKSQTQEVGEAPTPKDCLTDFGPANFAKDTREETGIAIEKLVNLISLTNAMPEGHISHPNLLRQLRRREQMVQGEQDLDWGTAEVLAFASLVSAKIPLRLAGQDSGRGTFSHRHAVIRDQTTGADHVPLAAMAPDLTVEIHDSLLSEEAALGFEYGYSLARPEAMVIWEAQFGDFANGAQIPIDQYIAAGEAKWTETVGLTLLLPHGYDGQGPEHSSARLERFLQLAAEGNLRVANCSTSAQYFHLLRRQALDEERKPLILLTPKSLLRDPRAASPVHDLTVGNFQMVLEESNASPAKRVVLCSGKVFHDLTDAKQESASNVALVRLEQLYPFPQEAVNQVLAKHAGAKLIWCQEEPRNMGAWKHVLEFLNHAGLEVEFVGRASSASPATGSYRLHQAQQTALVNQALGI